MTKTIKNSSLPWFIVLIVSLPALWFAYDSGEIFLNSTSHEARIVSCDLSWSTYSPRPGGSGSSRSTTGYAPIAEYGDQEYLVGTFSMSSRKWCRKRIGDTVTVLIHNDTPDKNRINSFFQLWFFPTIAIGIFLMFLCAGRFRNPRITPTITTLWVGIFVFEFINNFYL